MTTYYVLSVEPCDTCNGIGRIYNSFWEQLSIQHPGYTNQQIEEFFLARGYQPQDIPDEERDCDQCGGVGVLTRQVELIEALNALGLTKDVREATRNASGIAITLSGINENA